MSDAPADPLVTAARRLPRHGAAMVEFVICLPVLMLLVFGSIEAANFMFLKQSLQVAAYEGAREAARSDATADRAAQAAEAILESREVKNGAVRFPEGGGFAHVRRGETISIEVLAPTRANSPLAGQFVPDRQLVARVTMVKE